MLPITPGGGNNNKNIEYVYTGCSSSTDISTAKYKFKLSTPEPGTSSFDSLFDIANYTIGTFSNEFIFTEAGVFFIDSFLPSNCHIKIHTLNGYRTGDLSMNGLKNYEIFCDKDNNIIHAEEYANIEGKDNVIFWAYNTNIPTK